MAVYTILTRKGVVDAEQEQKLANLADELARPGAKLLLHLHGGLVDETAGSDGATRLSGTGPKTWNCGPEWTQLYVVWRTGALQEVLDHWKELATDDRLYRAVVRKLIGFVARRLGLPGTVGRGPGPVDLSDDEIERRLLGLADSQRPFADVDDLLDEVPPAGDARAALWPSQGNGELMVDFEAELAADDEFQLAAAQVDEAVNVPSGARGPARGVDLAVGAKSLTRLDAAIRAELEPRPIDGVDGRRGVVSASAFLLTHAGKVALRCFRRFRSGRDHGLHATVVEEVCREFYGDLIGAKVWGFMVGDAGRHFGNGGFGGSLVDILRTSTPDTIVVTAHSAGSIWASHLLLALAEAGIPARVRLFLLAPAVRQDLFAKAIDSAGHLVERCRMITMTDHAERRDPVLGTDLGYIYPSSLLYLVSGMFEEQGKTAYPDAPLVGLQRFSGATWLTAEEAGPASRIASFFQAPDRGIVSAPTPGVAEASSHGAFDDDPATLATARALF